jgi:hypothetical protein
MTSIFNLNFDVNRQIQAGETLEIREMEELRLDVGEVCDDESRAQ